MKPVVLVTNADPELRELFERFLVRKGHAVETASGGVECLDKLRRIFPDVLVLDQELPWGGGDGVLACLREDGPAPPPAVVFTTWNAAACPPGLLAQPVVACLEKPFAMAELLMSIRAVRQAREHKRNGMESAAPSVHTGEESHAGAGPVEAAGAGCG